MKKQLLLLTYSIALVLVGFVGGQYALRQSVAQQIALINGLYNPMDEMVLSQKGDLGITVSLVDRVLVGDLREFYRLSCLRVTLTLDSLANTPPEYSEKFYTPAVVADAKAMLSKLQARGHCLPNSPRRSD